MNFFAEIFFWEYSPYLFGLIGLLSLFVSIKVGNKRMDFTTYKGWLGMGGFAALCFGTVILIVLATFDFHGYGWQFSLMAKAQNVSVDLKVDYQKKPDHFYKLTVMNSSEVVPRSQYFEKRDYYLSMAKEDGSEKYFDSYLESLNYKEDIRPQVRQLKLDSYKDAVDVAGRYVDLPNGDAFVDDGKTAGPSAGLIYTLELIHQFGEQDLIKGRIIAGTGAINNKGEVEMIGQVKQKLMAAKDAGAVICFIPKGNEDSLEPEFVESLKPMKVVSVRSIQEALDAL